MMFYSAIQVLSPFGMYTFKRPSPGHPHAGTDALHNGRMRSRVGEGQLVPTAADLLTIDLSKTGGSKQVGSESRHAISR